MHGVHGVHGVLRGSEFTYEDKNSEKVEKKLSTVRPTVLKIPNFNEHGKIMYFPLVGIHVELDWAK